MKNINLNRGWQLVKEPPAIFFIMQQMGEKEIVNLPHDASIYENPSPDTPEGRMVGYQKGVFANYNQYIDIPKDWENQVVYLELDGVFAHSEISINGHLVKKHPSGYVPFYVNLTEFVKFGEKNRINVFANNSMQYTARWYHGTGIYRGVNLRVAPKVHLLNWPIFAYVKHITSEQATVNVNVTAENHTSKDTKVKAVIKFYEAAEHGEAITGDVKGYGEAIIYVPKNDQRDSNALITINQPKIWDIDHPNLYNIVVELYENGKLLDTDQTLFGIRTITLDTNNGLMLNGKSIKLKGGCVHHDQGILGAAVFYDSEYRKMKAHKDAGYNAIRSAHNPSSKEMLEACDRLGLIVMAEAFDVWNMPKNANDYHLYFDKYWEEDLELFMMRDRNHPSVFFWSIGNEIVERNHLSDGNHTAYKLAKKARELDPTRFVTAAMPTTFNGMNDDDTLGMLQSLMAIGGPVQNLSTPFSQEIWPDRTEAFCAPLDFVSYNYLDSRYEIDHKLYPNRVICGTESYPDQIDQVWQKVLSNNHVIGDFTWTSHDHLGEVSIGNVIYRDEGSDPVPRQILQSGAYPFRTSNCGDFDLLGFGRPQLHYRKIVWGSNETYIATHQPKNYGKIAQTTAWGWEDVDNTWTFEDAIGKHVNVDVYSSAEEVELLLNGKSLGRKAAGQSNRFKARFKTIYEYGELKAISYNNNQVVSEQTIISAQNPSHIQLKADRLHLLANGQSLAYVIVELVDKNGQRISYLEEKLEATIEGNATLQAFGSANPRSTENYTKGVFTSYKGRLLAIVRSHDEIGKATLKIKSEKYGESTLEFTVK